LRHFSQMRRNREVGRGQPAQYEIGASRHRREPRHILPRESSSTLSGRLFSLPTQMCIRPAHAAMKPNPGLKTIHR
jgi:hypothetical protein